MRAELIVDNTSKGRFEFAVAPRVGDSVLLKEESATVSEFRHNLDENRLQVLCTAPPRQQRQQSQAIRQTRPMQSETTTKKEE